MSNPRIALPALMLVVGIIQGCGGDAAPANVTVPLAAERSNYPFKVTEPPVYSAKIVVTSGARTHEYLVARNGERSRTDLHVATVNHTSRITDSVREVVISHATKTYYEVPRGSGDTADLGESNSTIRGLFASAEPSKFESLGKENGFVKYRVRPSPEDTSESYVFVDDAVGMVVKHELYAGEGDARTLVYSSDLRDLRLEAADDLFNVPAGFKRINAP